MIFVTILADITLPIKHQCAIVIANLAFALLTEWVVRRVDREFGYKEQATSNIIRGVTGLGSRKD